MRGPLGHVRRGYSATRRTAVEWRPRTVYALPMRAFQIAFVAWLLLAFPACAQSTEIAFGAHPLQRMDVTRATGTAPLVVFIHGGAWRAGDKSEAAAMTTHFQGRGYTFASVNYRLRPNVTVDAQAEDIAAAIAVLLERADTFGIDADRVMLLGHSAGAHLAALVSTDPRYLARHDLSPSLIDGVALLDSAGYDVPAQVRDADAQQSQLYRQIFGEDVAPQRALSPVIHVQAPNAAAYEVIYISSRENDSGAQSRRFATALVAAGTQARTLSVDDTHGGIFYSFGQPGHEATALVDAFAARVFAHN